VGAPVGNYDTLRGNF